MTDSKIEGYRVKQCFFNFITYHVKLNMSVKFKIIGATKRHRLYLNTFQYTWKYNGDINQNRSYGIIIIIAIVSLINQNNRKIDTYLLHS